MKFKKIELNDSEKNAVSTSYFINEGYITNDIITNCFYSLLFQMIKNYKPESDNTEIIIPYVGKIVMSLRDNELLQTFIPNKELKNIMSDISSGEVSILEKAIYQDINSLFNKITNNH